MKIVLHWVRVCNPTSQAGRFDPHGEFIGRYVPETNSLSYPAPIVNHGERRAQALALYRRAA